MTAVKWYLLVGVICLLLGFLIGAKMATPKYIPGNQTNVSTNLAPAPRTNLPALAILTNTVTNQFTLSNIIFVFTDDSNRRAAPFINAQNMDKLTVQKYDQSEVVQLLPWYIEKQNYIGVGVLEVLQDGSFISNMVPELFYQQSESWWRWGVQVGYNGKIGVLGANIGITW